MRAYDLRNTEHVVTKQKPPSMVHWLKTSRGFALTISAVRAQSLSLKKDLSQSYIRRPRTPATILCTNTLRLLSTLFTPFIPKNNWGRTTTCAFYSRRRDLSKA